MRIIAGKYRHRIIKYPENNKETRPTKDRIRESIFNALGEQVNNKVVLDLYAGSGSFGLEALSRGAKKAIFVDCNEEAIKTIKENIKDLNIQSNEYILMKNHDITALSQLKDNGVKIDILFLDPPYKEGKYLDIINLCDTYNLFNKNNIIVIEMGHPLTLDLLNTSKSRDYKHGEIITKIIWRQ